MEAAVVASRAAQYAGAVVLFGAPLFRLYALDGAPQRWRGRLLLPAAVLVLVGAGAALALQTINLAGSAAFSAMAEVATGTTFGHGLSARLILAGLAAALAPFAHRRGACALLAIFAAGVLASFAWTGHGGDGEGALGAAHRAADVAHLWAAGVWLGALAALAVLLSDARRDAAAVAEASRALSRFSGVGTGVVAVLVLTGLVNTVVLMGWRNALHPYASAYGLALLAKLALFAAMLALAAANRWRLAPRLAADLSGDRSGALAAARKSVLVETGLGLLVLAAVAVLGTLSPPE